MFLNIYYLYSYQMYDSNNIQTSKQNMVKNGGGITYLSTDCPQLLSSFNFYLHVYCNCETSLTTVLNRRELNREIDSHAGID